MWYATQGFVNEKSSEKGVAVPAVLEQKRTVVNPGYVILITILQLKYFATVIIARIKAG